MVNKDIVEGKAKQVQGRLEDAVGDLTGNPDHDVKGKTRVAEGKLQEGYGNVKEALRETNSEIEREPDL